MTIYGTDFDNASWLLAELKAIASEGLALDEALATQVAGAILGGMRERIGGRRVYVPAPDRTKRDCEIRRAFNGRNALEVARQFGVSRSTVYRICSEGPRERAGMNSNQPTERESMSMNNQAGAARDLGAIYSNVNRLAREGGNVLANMEAIDARARKVGEELTALDEAYSDALRRGGPAAVEKIIEDQEEAKQRIARLKEERDAARRLRDTVGDELRAAMAQAQTALSMRAAEIKQDLIKSIRGDKRIQQLLADVFLAEWCTMDPGVRPNGITGNILWPNLIEEVFQMPGSEVIEARELTFRQIHGIPRVADVGIRDE